MNETVTLYRPTGPEELALVKESGYTKWPPRPYQVHQVGGSEHTEWWIPAEELDELNTNIVGLIEVIHEFHA